MTFWNLVTFPSWKSLFFCKSECISSSSCLSADSLVTHCWTLHWCERSGKWENSGWALRLYLLYFVQGALKHWSIADCGFYCFLSCSKEPGQQRVKRWGFGMDEALKDPVGREQFLKFLESEFSSENLRWKTLCFSSSQDTSYFLVNIFLDDIFFLYFNPIKSYLVSYVLESIHVDCCQLLYIAERKTNIVSRDSHEIVSHAYSIFGPNTHIKDFQLIQLYSIKTLTYSKPIQ